MTDQIPMSTITTQLEPGQGRSAFTFRATHVVWFLFTLLEAVIGLRIVLKLMAADPNNPIAIFVYSVSNRFVAPFAGLAVAPAAGGVVLELSSVIAMLVYALVGWALERLVWVVLYRPQQATVAVTRTITDRRSH